VCFFKMEEQKKHRLSSLDVSTSLEFFDCVLQDYSSPRMPSDVIRSCLFRKLKFKSLLVLRRVCKRFNSIIKEEKWFSELLKTGIDRKQKELRKFITSNKGKIARREQKLRSIQEELLELRQEAEEAEEKIEVIKETKKEIERSQKKLKKD
jgi:septal ring factor EnvC (AmiA/AmiB activator)